MATSTATPRITVKWKKRTDMDVWGMFLYEGDRLSKFQPQFAGRISRQSGGEENPDVYIVTVGATHSPNNHTTALSLRGAKEGAQKILKRLLNQLIEMGEQPTMPQIATEEQWQE